ncbi:DUF2293 domain-containing protein [candidate division WOR-3 bacterium]|nr:DUF2293 domain-containing protein [candidate division WOR-3 bacterium]
MNEKKQKSKDLLVYIIRRDSQCAECGKELPKGSFLYLEKGKPLCLSCADFDHLGFLPSGDRALTIRAKKYSKISAIVLQWSRTRKRYERQGILVEEKATEQAMQECLSDADFREERRKHAALKRVKVDEKYVREFADHIRKLFPGCIPQEAYKIAGHACQRYSGRIGRTSMAKQFDPQAILLAVRAHIRHEHTNYDELFMKGLDRSSALCQVEDKIEEILEKWQCSP